MNIADFLQNLADRKVELFLVEGRLCYRAPEGALTTELRGGIAAHRAAIIEHLQRGDPPFRASGRCKPCDPAHWLDSPPKDGRIRTTCGKCGRFIGYRPAEPRLP